MPLKEGLREGAMPPGEVCSVSLLGVESNEAGVLLLANDVAAGADDVSESDILSGWRASLSYPLE